MMQIKEKLKNLTHKPGVYLMKDSGGKIIYVGKAKNLKNRVSQYFGNLASHTIKVRRMVENIEDFDYIITDTEFEALVLECNLIKLYRPKYNILLKDDKQFPFIRVDIKDEYPKMILARKKSEDGALYFGPYPGAGSVKQTISQLNRIFMLPSCKKKFPRDIGRGRPCLNYHIKRCAGLCGGHMSAEEYRKNFNSALRLLKEGPQMMISDLEEQMEQASQNFEFERCAVLRDEIKNIRGMYEPQKVYSNKKDRDVIAFYEAGVQAGFVVLTVRDGKLISKDVHLYNSDEILSLDEAYGEFLSAYYEKKEVPAMILVDCEFEGMELAVKMLSGRRGKKIQLKRAKKGEDARLLDMAGQNIKDAVLQKMTDDGRDTALLREIRDRLDLPKLPVRIEAYDISNTGKSDMVGVMVAFTKGRADKKRYRTFKIGSIESPDDYTATKEIIYRRIEKFQEGDSGFSPLPDVIFLDGGQGHLHAVAPMLAELAPGVEAFGLVKDGRHRLRGVVTKRGEIPLCAFAESGPLLGTISDEAHRFALSFHHKRRKKKMTSQLENIRGVGPRTRTLLLSAFQNIQSIRSASVQDLSKVKGITEKTARAVYDYFNGGEI